MQVAPNRDRTWAGTLHNGRRCHHATSASAKYPWFCILIVHIYLSLLSWSKEYKELIKSWTKGSKLRIGVELING